MYDGDKKGSDNPPTPPSKKKLNLIKINKRFTADLGGGKCCDCYGYLHNKYFPIHALNISSC